MWALRIHTAIAVLLLWALHSTGCAAVTVNSYLERDVNLQRFQTFAWGPADTRPTGDPRLDNNEFFDARVRMQVERMLARKGLEKSSSGTPDLLVHYHASVIQEIDTRELDRAYGYCEDGDCEPYVYDAGSLVIDLVEPGSKQVIWRGWAEGGIEGLIDNQEGLEQRIDESVTKILERLPRRLL